MSLSENLEQVKDLIEFCILEGDYVSLTGYIYTLITIADSQQKVIDKLTDLQNV